MRSRLSTFLLLVVLLMTITLGACSEPRLQTAEHADRRVVHWGYESHDGPALWGSLDSSWSLCALGREQSPIDLTASSPIGLPPFAIDLPSLSEVRVRNQSSVVDALDNGHTIQINVNAGSELTVGDDSYDLVQFHFHAPSEHTIDGMRYPMEIHFVHQAVDGSLAVVGVLVESGEKNPAVEPLWEQLANAPGTETALQIPAEFASRLFTGKPTGIYHYEGSLTTPPCSESVQWFVRRTPTQLSPEQIARFTAVYDHNNRPLQARGDRRVFLDEAPRMRAE